MRKFCSVNEWWGCVKNAASHLLKGFCLLANAVFVGVVSVMCALWRFLSSLVGRYPSVALGAFLVALYVTWLLTFVSMRSRAICAEDRCSAISYEYTTFKEQHGF